MKIVKNEDAIRNQKKIMIFTGLWPKRFAFLRYRILGHLNVLLAVTTVIFQIHGVITREDFAILAENWHWLLQCLTYAGKLCLFILYKQKMLSLLDSIEQPVFYDYRIEQNKYIKQSVKVTNLLRNVYHYLAVSGALFVCLVTIIRSRSEKKLLLDFGFDFDRKPIIFLNIVCLYQVVFFLIGVFNVTSMDTTLLSMLRLIKAHFQILRRMIIIDTTNGLGDTSDSYTLSQEEIINKEIGRRLSKCVMYHIAILR